MTDEMKIVCEEACETHLQEAVGRYRKQVIKTGESSVDVDLMVHSFVYGVRTAFPVAFEKALEESNHG